MCILLRYCIYKLPVCMFWCCVSIIVEMLIFLFLFYDCEACAIFWMRPFCSLLTSYGLQISLSSNIFSVPPLTQHEAQLTSFFSEIWLPIHQMFLLFLFNIFMCGWWLNRNKIILCSCYMAYPCISSANSNKLTLSAAKSFMRSHDWLGLWGYLNLN